MITKHEILGEIPSKKKEHVKWLFKEPKKKRDLDKNELVCGQTEDKFSIMKSRTKL